MVTRVLPLLVLVLVLLLAARCAGAQTTVIYSRADAAHADRAVRLARVFDQVLVDVQLVPGVAWRAAMADGICRSRLVLVLWSERAAASTELAREIATAVLCRVPLVPVLIDSTPLSGDLAGVQAVDWR